MPATRPDKLPPIDVGAWVRASARFQRAYSPKKIDDFAGMDAIYGELHAGGKVHKNVSVTLNLNANGLAKSAGIEDAIIGFDFVDPFHIWVGQLLVPVDRANGSGPFFMIPWNYPGFFTVGATTVVGAPVEGPYGRNAGAVVWGDFLDGRFKYLAGAFKSADPAAANPLLSARLQFDVIGAEPGFWGNASYFGDKDTVGIGVGAQYQKDGSVGPVPVDPITMMPTGPAPTDNYSDVNADVLAEFKLGGGGWVTGEAAYYHFGGDYSPGKLDEFFILGAVASPVVGIGNIQPMIRYQMAKNDDVKLSVSAVDVGVGYLIKGPALRTSLTYQHVDLGSDPTGADRIGNSLQLSAQAIFF
jgi:hypothetical protein